MAKNPPSIDLHGYTVEEAQVALDDFLNKNSNRSKLRVVTGKGSGKVKKAVLSYLKLANYPWSYEKLKNGANNEGVLIIHND